MFKQAIDSIFICIQHHKTLVFVVFIVLILQFLVLKLIKAPEGCGNISCAYRDSRYPEGGCKKGYDYFKKCKYKLR